MWHDSGSLSRGHDHAQRDLCNTSPLQRPLQALEHSVCCNSYRKCLQVALSACIFVRVSVASALTFLTLGWTWRKPISSPP